MLKKAENYFVQLNRILLGSMLFVMFLLVIGNVISRYILGFSLNWAEELSRYLMIWTTFIGIGLAMRENRHVAIDFFQDYLPKKIVPIVRVFNAVILLSFMSFFAYLGYYYSISNNDQLTVVLRWPKSVIYLVIPISAILFIIHMIFMFKDYVNKSQTEGFNEPEK